MLINRDSDATSHTLLLAPQFGVRERHGAGGLSGPEGFEDMIRGLY